MINERNLKILLDHPNKSEVIINILEKKINSLKVEFDINTFHTLDVFLIQLESGNIKTDLKKDLNLIAKDNYVNYFIERIKSIGQVIDNHDLERISHYYSDIPKFIHSSTHSKIRSVVETYILNNSNFNGLIEACSNNFIKNPESVILSYTGDFMEEGLSNIMESSEVFSDEFKFNLLKYLVGHSTMYGWILNTVKERYDSDIYSEFDNLIFIISPGK